MEDTKCLSELSEILKFLAPEELVKIPEEIRNAIDENKDKEYVWHYDEAKSLSEQNIDRKTVAMIAYLNIEYLLSEKQRALMAEIHEFNEQKAEKEKQVKYSSDVRFRERENKKAENLPVVVEKESWFRRLCLFFKRN